MSERSGDCSRRHFLGSAAALAGSATLTGSLLSSAAGAEEASLVAHPPDGFTPLARRGYVVKVTMGDDLTAIMQPNQLWPRPEVARKMVEKALTELTGEHDLPSALGRFVHKDDVVAVKVNGIAGQSGRTMATNLETLLPIVEGLVALGVPADAITLYEQFGAHMLGTRVTKSNLPKGVKLGIHGNVDARMRPIEIRRGIKTKFVRFLTEATAVINVALLKDHSITGYTGCIKNIAQGSITTPAEHHFNHGSPQIADTFAHPIVQSRMRLHLTDGFKMIYDEGPLDKNPRRRILHGAIYASTDAVAMDMLGWSLVEKARAANGLPTLAERGREPKYLKDAAALELGEGDLDRVTVKEVSAELDTD
ncbi:MAG: DUF362 domain-containing protein [Sorangiineae bacterium]|nr:DUF362 domain-containing protein [Polyangiaceae bacterium]MEB2322843.1 DUF362 domain-containing protein [Sorangiineae bacterium]